MYKIRFKNGIFLLQTILAFSEINLYSQLIVPIDSIVVKISVLVDSNKCIAPWDVTWGVDDQLWFSDGPFIKKVNPSTGIIKTMYNRPSDNGLGLCFYVDSSTKTTYLFAVFDTSEYYKYGNQAKLIRLNYSPQKDSLYNEKLIITYPHNGEHSGGRLAIGVESSLIGSKPTVYLSTADYFSCLNDGPNNLYGKILRIGIDGEIPMYNPRTDYTFSFGHRNPQGLTFTNNGALICSEHGQFYGGNELNQIRPNKYYGYPIIDGNEYYTLFKDTLCESWLRSNYAPPIITQAYPPSGIDFYKNDQIPVFKNCILEGLLGDPYKSGLGINVYEFYYIGQYAFINKKSNYFSNLEMGRIRDICSDNNGKIYLITNDRANAKIRCIERINLTSNYNYKSNSHIATLYPNPAKECIYLISKAKEEVPITAYVYSLEGKLINQFRIQKPKFQIPINNIKPGSYYLLLLESTKIEILKFGISY